MPDLSLHQIEYKNCNENNLKLQLFKGNKGGTPWGRGVAIATSCGARIAYSDKKTSWQGKHANRGQWEHFYGFANVNFRVRIRKRKAVGQRRNW